MGEYGGENVITCYEDEKTIKNVGKSEITESEPSLSTDDNAPRLDQDVARPPSQKDRPTVSANRARPLLLLSANRDAYRRGIRMRRDTTPTHNSGKASLSTSDDFAVDSARPQSSINESVLERWNGDSALPDVERVQASLVTTEGFYQGLSSSTDATPRNYGRMPLIMDIYADNNVRPLPSVNEDAYGGGVRMSRFTINHNYGKGPSIREIFSSNSVRPLPSVANEDRARPLQSVNGNHSLLMSSTDATPRNHGRTPLIMDDFYDDNNVRPLQSVNEDAYGGGVRMSRFTTNYNYGKGQTIRENFSSNSVRPLPAVANDEKASLVSDEFAVINISRPPLSSINEPLYEWWNSDLEASRSHGKAPMIEKFIADSASPQPPVHPTQQKSTRLVNNVNSSFGSCFPCFGQRMRSRLLKNWKGILLYFLLVLVGCTVRVAHGTPI